MLKDARKSTQASVNNILDTFSGADGGVRFAVLIAAITRFDKEAAAGDVAAERVIGFITAFSRLIDTVCKGV